MDEPITRVCSYCQLRQPASALARTEASGWQCLDTQSCSDRAQASDLYARSENELEIAALESRQGALR